MTPASSAQITAIRTLASRAGLDEDTYRDFLEREAGVRSTKALSFAAAGRVIDRLRVSSGQSSWAKGSVAGLDSPVAKKLQALWLTGYNLGLIHDRADKAMLSFLERQTGTSHTQFLSHPSEATAAIEALKSWLRRGGVEWPLERRRGDADVIEIKRAVIEAQWARLLDLGARQPIADLKVYASKATGRQAWDQFESHHYDEVQRSLGNRIRNALRGQRGEVSHAC
ncbi:hypothetical protein AFEL58S_01976 [Afipia felis]